MKRLTPTPGAVALDLRSKKVCEEEFCSWERRFLESKRYAYVSAEGVYFNVRLTGERACVLVVMGATTDGKKEVLAIHDGIRESQQSWTEVLERLKAQGRVKGLRPLHLFVRGPVAEGHRVPQ